MNDLLNCFSMTLLSGFNNSALFVIFAIYLSISLVVFILVMALLSNFSSFKQFLHRQKARSKALYILTLVTIFIASFALVSGILFIRYIIINKGLLE